MDERLAYQDDTLGEGVAAAMFWVLLTAAATVFFSVQLLNWTGVSPYYPRPAGGPSPPNSREPGALYGAQWAMVFLLAANALPPLLLAWALMSMTRSVAADLHVLASLLALLACLATLAAMGWWWCTWCNGTNGYGSLCRDARWCCLEANRLAHPEQCPNVAPCTPPVDTKAELDANLEWRATFWLALAWVGANIIHTIFNARLRYYGAWKPGRFYNA